MSRPEDNLPPDLYYNARESQKYTTSSRIQHVQAAMTRRALQLLDLRRPSLVLDVGCGSGLSGSILSSATASTPTSESSHNDGSEDEDEDDGECENENDTSSNDNSTNGNHYNPKTSNSNSNSNSNSIATGPHTWIGLDISASMLSIALERDVEGDLLLADAGQGVPFRPGTFDAAISISALQWLCCINDNGTDNGDSMAADAPSSLSASHASATLPLRRFFTGLHAALRRGARAVCQFYPRDAKQRDLICGEAVRAGFSAGVLEDDPGTKHVKLFLVLRVGGGDVGDDDDEQLLGEKLGGKMSGSGGSGYGGSGVSGKAKGNRDITGVVSGLDNVDVLDRRKGSSKKVDKRGPERKGSKSWILKKKAQMERKGRVVKASSKYTGRKRRIAF